ncbi:MAG: SDR family NAD(P)-dependent oxidoreductase [Thermoplasmata archaeon]
MTETARTLLTGKFCVVTGATSGIGEVTARELMRKGAKVLIVGRDRARCESTIARFRTAGAGDVAYAVTNLSLLEEVRELARSIQQEYPPVNVLVNNAGAIHAKRETTSEGNERTLALNVLSPFLLTRLLEPDLRSGAPSRVVMVDSEAHRSAHLDLDDLDTSHHYRAFRAYNRSKLALLLLTYELAQRWNGIDIRVNAVHPGFVRSGFGKNNPGFFGEALAFAELIAGVSPERGARTVVFAASDPALEGISGKYLAHRHEVRSSRASYDTTVAGRLWALASARTGLPP